MSTNCKRNFLIVYGTHGCNDTRLGHSKGTRSRDRRHSLKRGTTGTAGKSLKNNKYVNAEQLEEMERLEQV